MRRAPRRPPRRSCVAAAGCSSNGGDDGQPASAKQGHDHPRPGRGGHSARRAARSTRAEIYDRLSPGVVTVLSIFDGGASLLGDGGEGGQGSGFVLDGDGYIATNAHVVTDGEPRRHRACRPGLRRVLRRQPRARRDRRRRPERRRRADQGRSGAACRSPRCGSAHSSSIAVGEPVAAIGSPFGERQSLIDRRDLGARPQHPARSRASRSATRSRPTPPSTPATPAGRCSTRKGGCSGSTRRSSRTPAAARAWASRSRWTPCGARCASCATTARVDYGYLGVSTLDAMAAAGRTDRPRRGRPARWSRTWSNGSPAEKAGLEAGDDKITFQGQTDIAMGGDLIVAVDGKPLTREHDLADVISAHSAGDKVAARRSSATATRRTVDGRAGQAPGAVPARSGVRELVRDLALALRERVLPQLGSHAGRAHEAAGGRRRRDLRDRRRGRARARVVPRRARAGRRLLLGGPRAGRARAAAPAPCSWWTRSTAPARRWPGSSRAACRSRPRRCDGEPTMGEVTVGCVVEIPSGAVFLAERGAGVVEGPPVLPVAQRADRPDVLDLRLPRPPGAADGRGARRPDRRLVGRRRQLRARLRRVRHDPRSSPASSTRTSSPARGWSTTCRACARSSSAWAAARCSTTRPTTSRPPL